MSRLCYDSNTSINFKGIVIILRHIGDGIGTWETVVAV